MKYIFLYITTLTFIYFCNRNEFYIQTKHINIIPSSKTYAVDLLWLNDRVYMSMLIGTPGQQTLIHLNTAKDITWTTPFYFNNHHSSTLSSPIMESIHVDSNLLKTAKYYDVITFRKTNSNFQSFDNTNINMSFYYFEEGEVNEYETIGLSFKYKNNDFNIINIMYQEKLIQYKQFSLINNEVDKNGNVFSKGMIVFGKGKNISYKRKNVSKGMCNVYTKSNFDIQWGCTLNYIELITKDDNIMIHNGENETYAYLQTNIKEIYAPLKQFIMITNEVRKYFGWEECDVIKKHFYFFLQCKCDVVERGKLKYIRFKIGEFIYKMDKLFQKEINDYCSFIIQYKTENSDVWILGLNFISNYDITFDYDNEMLTFYGVDIISLNSFNDGNKYLLLILFKGLITLLIVDIIFLFGVNKDILLYNK